MNLRNFAPAAGAIVLLAGCGAPSTPTRSATLSLSPSPSPISTPTSTPSPPSVTWSATGALPGDASGNDAVEQVAAGSYVVHMTGCLQSATLTGGAAGGNPFEGVQIQLYDGQAVLVPGDGAYTVSDLGDPSLTCSWTLTLTSQ